MSTVCRQTLTISIGDMPLDSAIYDSISNKIYGVRGQWAYRFSDIGGLEASLRFIRFGFGRASIAVAGANLVCSINNVWNVNWNDISGLASPDRDIFVVDKGLATSTAMGLRNFLSTTGATNIIQGWDRLLYIGGRIYGWNRDVGIFSTTGPGDVLSTGGVSFAEDIAFDSIHNYLWVADIYNYDVAIFDLTPNFIAGTPSTLGFGPSGVEFVNSVNAAYCITGNSLKKLSGAAPGTILAAFSLPGSFSSARLKYCPYASPHPFAGKLLIPTWSGDSVMVWTPGTDTLTSTKTGFSAPIDIVFTPGSPLALGKAFAVQNSPQGLREVSP